MTKPKKDDTPLTHEDLLALLNDVDDSSLLSDVDLPLNLFNDDFDFQSLEFNGVSDDDIIEHENSATVEKNKIFSKCILWQMQREYFEQQGVNAWNKQVPYYITSNIAIANSYANVYVRFIQDWLRKHPDSRNHPFYIMELGTGCGKFSFYCVKKINDLINQLGLNDVKICYIMSDFTQSNVKYWKQHEKLIPFVEAGLLDFAIFNMENDSQVHLINSDITIDAQSLVNPLMICANYIFDSISCDVFKVENGDLHESLSTFTTRESNMDNGKVIDWEQMDLSFTNRRINAKTYYDDPIWNQILVNYQEQLEDSYFSLPTASLRALENLRALANNKLLMIVSDKGHIALQQLNYLGQPEIEFHGSFSLMVNLHAVSEYFKLSGGNSVLQDPNNDLESGIFYSGFELAEYPETMQTISDTYINYSPADYFMLYCHARDNNESINLDSLAAYMKLSHNDPHMYNRIYQTVSNNIGSANNTTTSTFANCMEKVEDNFYFMPGSYDTYFQIAIFYHSVNHLEYAIDYYEKSINYFGDNYSVLYNIASAQNATDNYADALANIKKAIEYDPESEEAQELLSMIEENIGNTE